MTKIRVGIIGAGMAFERLHYPAYQELNDKYEIKALCDPDEAKLKKWAQQLNLEQDHVSNKYEDLLPKDDIDVFDIMVPIELNFTIAEAVAKAGKPIILEKPLGSNMEEAESCSKLPQKYSVPIMIAENFRYNEEVNILRDLIQNQKVGKPLYFLQNRVNNFPVDMLKNKFSAKEWRQHPEYWGGTFLDTGIHDLASLRHIFGAVQEVHAYGQKENADYAPYSVINANILFATGLTGQFTFFTSGQESQRPLVGLRIFCTDGMIYLEERDCGTINIAFNNGKKETISYQPQRGYVNELLNFYNSLTNKEAISVTPEIEFGDTKMVFDILKSIQKGTPIRVDKLKNNLKY
ncbi:Gfo/Idh/MocA family oxidoreductase [Bacillota bacterium LX-D]|nr:Gfo/Idh/MocA family oxidoreductase [Bacillota bacterium LX-D]